MKHPIITINHHELAVNLMDMDFTNCLVTANTALQLALSEAQAKHAKHAGDDVRLLNAKIKATCAFFDAVFGPGTARRIFKYSNEVVPYMDGDLPHSRTIAHLDA